MHYHNNQFAVYAGNLVALFSALFVEWYTVSRKRPAEGRHWPNAEATGVRGSFALLLDTPIGLLLAASIFFTLLLAANILGWTSVPWWVVAVGMILSVASCALSLSITSKEISVPMSPRLVVFATLAVPGLVPVGVPARRPQAMFGSPVTNLWK